MANLKNINFMSEERFNSLETTSENDLYAVDLENSSLKTGVVSATDVMKVFSQINHYEASTVWGADDLISIHDSTGEMIGYIRHFKDANGYTGIDFETRKLINGSWKYSRIAVGLNSSGAQLTYAPNCSINGSIVTTQAMSKGANGYLKLGNGIIIQWGTWSGGASQTKTLPTPFTTTNYSVTMNDYRNENNAYGTCFYTKTKTTFMIRAQCDTGNWIAIGY